MKRHFAKRIAQGKTLKTKAGAKLATVVFLVAGVMLAAPGSAQAAGANDIALVNAGSGLRADVMWASTSAFQGVFLWPTNASASQRFDLIDSGGGYYRIRARHSGQCLTVDPRGGGLKENGTRIVQLPNCTAPYTPQAEWRIEWVWSADSGSWYELLRNKNSQKCLDVRNSAGGIPGQQAVLQQWDCLVPINVTVSQRTHWNVWNQLWATW
jgi:hypothetical protein